MSGWLFFGFLKHQQYLQANPRVFLNDRMNHFQVFFQVEIYSCSTKATKGTWYDVVPCVRSEASVWYWRWPIAYYSYASHWSFLWSTAWLAGRCCGVFHQDGWGMAQRLFRWPNVMRASEETFCQASRYHKKQLAEHPSGFPLLGNESISHRKGSSENHQLKKEFFMGYG